MDRAGLNIAGPLVTLAADRPRYRAAIKNKYFSSGTDSSPDYSVGDDTASQ